MHYQAIMKMAAAGAMAVAMNGGAGSGDGAGQRFSAEAGGCAKLLPASVFYAGKRRPRSCATPGA